MVWSASGNVASFPTQLLTTTTNSAQFTMNLRFYADAAAGVVYLFGRWTMGTGTQAVQMNAVLLDPPFRPIGVVALECLNSTASGTSANLYVSPNGALSSDLPSTGGWNARIRSYYFTTITPG